MWFSGFYSLILSVIVEVYLWWKLQASLSFLVGRTCTIGGWLNTFLHHCIHITFLPHDAIYFLKCTSPSCSKAHPQHDAATPVLHGWNGVLRLANLPLFPPNLTMVIMAKQFYFCFIRPEDISPKSTIFVPMWYTSNWLKLCELAYQKLLKPWHNFL